MAKPFITLTQGLQLVPPQGQTFDLSAATGGVQGNSGADFNIDNGYCKADGGYQCYISKINSPYENLYYWGDNTFAGFNDVIGDVGTQYLRQQSTNFGNNGDAGTGIGFTNMDLDNNNRCFVFIGRIFDPASWLWTATASDNSFTPITWVNNGQSGTEINISFQLDFCGIGIDPAAKLHVTCTKQSGAQGQLSPRFEYLKVPVPAPQPTGMVLGFNP